MALALRPELSVWAPASAAILVGVGGASAVGFVAASVGATDEKERRNMRKAERRLKFWRSRFGKTIFKLAGIGLRKRVSEIRATHRPTEIQIGLAAEGLFESLPKETRKAVGDVPATLTRLEADATKLRGLADKLTAQIESKREPSDQRMTARRVRQQESTLL